MFDFPNSPSNGQVFAPTGGPVYVYSGSVWRMQGSGQVVTAEARNRIVNPCFQVSQENGSTGGNSNGFCAADQWLGSHTTTGSLTYQRAAQTTLNGSLYKLSTNVNTADTSLSGEWWAVVQSVEGIRIADWQWGTANAKQVILRFGVRSNTSGTFGGAIRNAAANRSFIFSYTIAAGEVNAEVIRTVAIPGDTTGVWPTDNTKAFDLFFAFASATGVQGPPGWNASGSFAPTGMTNGLAGVGVNFLLSDVGLYLDPNATGVPPPWQMPDEAEELLACMRYYEKAQLVVNPTTSYQGTRWTVPKRVSAALSAVFEAGSGATFTPYNMVSPFQGFYQVGGHNQPAQALVTGNSRM